MFAETIAIKVALSISHRKIKSSSLRTKDKLVG